jgi:hypothetical protein
MLWVGNLIFQFFIIQILSCIFFVSGLFTRETPSAPKKRKDGEKVAVKNNSILNNFGEGGLRADKLIRHLNNHFIAGAKSFADYLDFQWYQFGFC